ncbi:MAG: hypothetical protein HFI31_00370 [Lachnospiraceae bacterium]|nr:hypothetical protein [Lachnospiraceae bacterium]
MNGLEKLQLYWNTIKCLRPVQIRHQIGNRLFKNRRKGLLIDIKNQSVPEINEEIALLIPELDCEEYYLKRFPVEKLLNNEVEILHETHRITNIWDITCASHLWNYNLHYLEFLIPLAVTYRKTGDERYFLKWEELMNGWLKQNSDDSWEPYTISMRIPNLLICMEILKEKIENKKIKEDVITSIYHQYRYLICTQELALLANHYFENLKTIVISSLYFNELDIYHKYYAVLLDQIREQILPDGFHFERSFMYHRIILEDILRINMALESGNQREDAKKLLPVMQKMTLAMIGLERGFEGRIPLFHDAGNNVSKDKTALCNAVEKICDFVERRGLIFENSGYYSWVSDDTAILFDCGDLGPSYMGGHGHCSCLSFEMSVGGKILFTNSGTGMYQGKRRAFFRSTPAHNTMMIDDREQSELWGEHRVGRRIHGIRGAVKEDMLVGKFQSYLGDSFKRKMSWKKTGVFIIEDEFKAHDTGDHRARQFIHIAPGYEYEQDEKQIKVKSEEREIAVIRIPEKSHCIIYTEGDITTLAEDFGAYETKQVLEIQTKFEKSIYLKIEIELKEWRDEK